MPHPDLTGALAGLGLPQPERARILEEIAGDLEELRDELERRGMDPAEAAAEATRMLAPSEAALAALASVHEPLYASLIRRFSSGMKLAEWLALVGVTSTAIGVALSGLAEAHLLRGPSPWLPLLLLATVSVFVLAGRKALHLYVARDHEPERLHGGMHGLLIGSALAVVIGLGGAAFEALRMAARLEQEPSRALELFMPWLLEASILIGAGLTTALVGGLAWFLLNQKIHSIETAELRATHAFRRAIQSALFDPPLPLTGGPS